jgi:hypothetical protein
MNDWERSRIGFIKLEADQWQIITTAGATATETASAVAGGIISDAVTRDWNVGPDSWRRGWSSQDRIDLREE